jgi:hypothetical protein
MKIAIVGSKPDTWEACKELDRRTWKIWRFSRKNYELEPKASLWFELHHPRNYQRFEDGKPGYLQFLKDCGAVTYEQFPFGELIDEFGPWWFTSGTAPWLLAHAIMLKPEEIRIYGIAPGPLYADQRKEILHFFEIAKQLGIKCSAPVDPTLMEYQPLYAIEKDWGDQEKWLALLQERGIKPVAGKGDTRQTEFASDLPRNKLIMDMRAKQESRRAKYGKNTVIIPPAPPRPRPI